MSVARFRVRVRLVASASSFQRRIWVSGAPRLAAWRATSRPGSACAAVVEPRRPPVTLALAMVDRDGVRSEEAD
eukprot:3039134-Alexandrium_andersonii.AAC.1